MGGWPGESEAESGFEGGGEEVGFKGRGTAIRTGARGWRGGGGRGTPRGVLYRGWRGLRDWSKRLVAGADKKLHPKKVSPSPLYPNARPLGYSSDLSLRTTPPPPDPT